MDLAWKVTIVVAMAGLSVAGWRVTAAAVRRASQRRRAAAGHGLGDDARRHTYASRIADDQLAAMRRDHSARLVQEIAQKAAGWYPMPPRNERPLRPLPWQEPAAVSEVYAHDRDPLGFSPGRAMCGLEWMDAPPGSPRCGRCQAAIRERAAGRFGLRLSNGGYEAKQ